MRAFLRAFRVLFGVLVAFMISSLVVLLALLSGVFLSAKHANWFAHQWGPWIAPVLRIAFGRKVILEVNLMGLDPDRPVVVWGPHPFAHELPEYAAAVDKLFKKHLFIPIGKIELKRGPFGWAVKMLGGVLVDRGDATQAVPAIRSGVQRFPGSKICIQLFPDGTRGDKQGRMRSFAWAKDKKLDRLAESCDVIMTPRAKGMKALAQALPDAQWVRVVVATEHGATSIPELLFHQLGDVHVRFDLVESPPVGEEKAFDLYLYECHWPWCADFIRKVRDL